MLWGHLLTKALLTANTPSFIIVTMHYMITIKVQKTNQDTYHLLAQNNILPATKLIPIQLPATKLIPIQLATVNYHKLVKRRLLANQHSAWSSYTSRAFMWISYLRLYLDATRSLYSVGKGPVYKRLTNYLAQYQQSTEEEAHPHHFVVIAPPSLFKRARACADINRIVVRCSVTFSVQTLYFSD